MELFILVELVEQTRVVAQEAEEALVLLVTEAMLLVVRLAQVVLVVAEAQVRNQAAQEYFIFFTRRSNV
jgi:hypothetical protein